MTKYSSYIELSPTYESVVDADSEKRNPNLWHDYIVHEDMRNAVDKICQSVREETRDARRSFWIHGAYGTGKTYAALVIKHLFEDELEEVSRFLSTDLLMPFKNNFISIRERGDFLVIWKSGCTGIRSGMQLMMEMEVAIRERLREKFGDNAYYGSQSLINSVKGKLNDRSINWDHVFNDQEFGLFEDYVSMDELRQDIESNDLKAAGRVAGIMMEKGWGLMGNVDNFMAWVKDVIEGNSLADGGIIFIWDEFTGFLRDCGDDNVLQRLSEYCKQQPFFLFLIVHRDPGWVENMGEQTYRRIMHRYHELEFHISESAAYDLIGSSILIRPGMQEQWDSVKKDLISKIRSYLPAFDQLDMDSVQDRISQLCPIHPMIISMLAIVAQNFGASQRTLFRFMKDAKEAEESVGFTYYIKNNSPFKWRWLTPDYLWDYFFTRDSDMKELSSEAKKCHLHFLQNQEFAGGETAQHIFKAIMLLIAVMSTSKTTYLHSAISRGRVSATKKSLYLCFAGQLTSEDIDKYLEIFEENGLIRLDRLSHDDSRLELPYSGQSDVFSLRLEQMEKKYTRYQLLSKGGRFSEVIEKRFSDDGDAINHRMIISACSSEANSINVRYKDLSDDLAKNPHKIGVLLIVPKEASEYQTLPAKAKSMLQGEETGRMVIGVVKEPLTEDVLDRWREAMTHSELAAEEGKKGSADRYYNEAAELLESWVGPAINGQITAFDGGEGVTYASWGRADLMRRIKDGVIFSIFSAAPERFIVRAS